MATAQSYNEDQQKFWNGPEGEFWTNQQDLMDRTMSNLMAPLLEFTAPEPGVTVIDVGCGCGATTLELARAVSPTGRVLGLDISRPMLDRARQRLQGYQNATCRLADAATADLRDVHADLLFSRFGVMFFGDPTAAFTNLRSGLKPGARVSFACWRALQDNPWMTVPYQAVLQHVPKPEPPDPDAPGPFAFANPERVTAILQTAGFIDLALHPLDFDMLLGGGGSLDEAAAQMVNIGPAGRALKEHPEDIKEAARVSVREALQAYQTAAGLRLPGGVWLVSAKV
jgi:SAM-dependent methyltransferase